MDLLKSTLLFTLLLVFVIYMVLPSKLQIIQSLEMQHLPTPIFASWFELWMILQTYGK